MPQVFAKDPDAVLDYMIDWSDWLGATDTIASATWTVPDGLTEDSSTETTTTATIWLSGGTAGASYALVCRVVTTEGRTDDRTITIVGTNK